MKYYLSLFFIALSFLSCIQIPFQKQLTTRQIGHSIMFYPWVGLFMGGLLYFFCAFILFFDADFPSEVLAALVLALWALITGGLHLDGLADSADAWVGGLNDREKTLKIMKDPYCGPAGVSALLLTLLIKWTAITYLIKTDQNFYLIVVPMISRAGIIVLFMTTVYVRTSGLGSVVVDSMPAEKSLWSTLLLCSIVYILVAELLSFLFVVIVLILLRKKMIKRIGGMTGDTIGAMVEITEAVALVALLI